MRYFLLLLLAASPLHAQQLQPIGWKDPELATILGVVLTGGGQFYTGRAAKGAALLVGSAAGLVVAAHASQSACGTGSCGSGSVETGGIVAAVALWAYGWATASHDATLHNDAIRNGAFLDHQNGRTLVGIRLAMR